MSRRTFEGPMDWEYQNNRGPVDVSSPFSQIPQRPFMGPSFGSSDSPSKLARSANPFASIGANAASSSFHANPPSPSKQQFPRPPSSSIFNAPSTKSYPAASPFRNPAFTTPQKPREDIFSEASGAEESPAVQSDASMAAEDTPEYERFDSELAQATITPASAVNRKLFHDENDSPASTQSQQRQASPSRPTSSHASGRGAVPRGKLDYLFGRRDRVRKRKRQLGDKDVGSVRSRHNSNGNNNNYTSDESDDSDASEWTDGGRSQRRRGGGDGKKGRRGREGGGPSTDGTTVKRGAIGSLFSAIHDHPNVPLILSWWLQLGMNVFFMAVVMWFVWGGISMMRADISHAADAARSRLLAQMNDCAHEYTKNRCAPLSERLPALNVMCNEWEVCMNQDPSSVMKLQVSAKNVAEIINEFVGVMSFKAWGFILSAMLAVILASNMGFSRFRDAAFVDNAKPNLPSPHAYASQPVGGPPGPSSLPSSQDPNQAYIWAPIGQTPRHIRREFMLQPDTPTDTDGSPDVVRAAIMPPPQTPSFRRSPSKGERERSPAKAKANRSPNKVY
ncbi:nuclear envelope protein [Sporothrix brasiliensis 5110]|uniref:Nuclear envelope protein n=1 Tax=Sporothrix brasiliensis 5110 TaxID=1398154 RepID=A0A0C2F8I4_9PEZI|nr:nuclear envelope protein [Sporothrix brasiliensis 5110]KIH87368.1 nuclear envelope protein [Sporothrix brasiliensis 5110]